MGEKMRKVKGLLIKTNNDISIVTLDDDADDIRDLIGVSVFDVTSAGGASFYVDDEGMLNDSPVNIGASVLYRFLGGMQSLYGNVLVLGCPDDEGYGTDIPDEVLEWVGVSA